MRPKSHTAVVAVLVAVLLGGCMHQYGQVLNVRNDTGEQLRLSIETGAGDIERGDLDPGVEGDVSVPAGGPASDCWMSPWVARTETGVEVDRMEPPICPGDTWVIKDRR